MKFAYIVMFELRSLPKTIDDLYSRIIDYYDADVFLICQNQFEDDEERVKLFSRRLVKSELYTKPDPNKYFGNSPKLLPPAVASVTRTANLTLPHATPMSRRMS